MLQAALAVCTVLLVKHLFDAFVTAETPDSRASMLPAAAGLVAALLATSWLRMVERVRAERLGQDYALEVRMVVFRHLTRLEPRLLQQRSRGGLCSCAF